MKQTHFSIAAIALCFMGSAHADELAVGVQIPMTGALARVGQIGRAHV